MHARHWTLQLKDPLAPFTVSLTEEEAQTWRAPVPKVTQLAGSLPVSVGGDAHILKIYTFACMPH